MVSIRARMSSRFTGREGSGGFRGSGVQGGVCGGVRSGCGSGGGADGGKRELLFGFRRGGLGGGGLRQLDLAEFVGVREIVNGTDAKVLEKNVGGLVEEGPAGKFRATADADEVAVEEFLDHAVTGHPPDGLDGGLGDRLAVGDDGQRFHRRAAEAFRFAAGEHLADELAELGAGVEFPAFRAFEDGEGTTVGGVGLVQLGDGLEDVFRRGRGEGIEPFRKRWWLDTTLGVANPDVIGLGHAGADQTSDFIRGEGVLGGEE